MHRSIYFHLSFPLLHDVHLQHVIQILHLTFALTCSPKSTSETWSIWILCDRQYSLKTSCLSLWSHVMGYLSFFLLIDMIFHMYI